MDVSDTGSLQDGQPPPEPPNLPSTVAVAPRTPVYHLLQMWRRMLPTCVDCGAGKYSGAEKATAATVCVDCGAGTYVNVHDVPVSVKIVIACGQTLLVLLLRVWMCSPALSGCSLVWKGMYQVNIRHGLFAVCGHDVVSRFTTLSNITIKILSLLFWVSLGSILRSVIASLVLSFYSKIELSWPTLSFSFAVQRKILATNAQIHGLLELWYGLKTSHGWLYSQCCCIYRGPAVPACPRGWDWAIWVQTLVFTVYKNLRKAWKNRCGQTTE
jgi:hypothetical protein